MTLRDCGERELMGQKLWRMLTVVSALLMLTAPALAVSPDEGNACQIIREEVGHYYAEGGACPCPYHAASDGHLCGGRSAWAKRQGASPRCFISESAIASAPVVTVNAHHSRWPDPPACGAETMGARPTPPRTAETRPAALSSSQ